jgi:hypothetical protein
MANPPQLFRADGLDERVLHRRPWSVGVVDKIGSDPRSTYVAWAEGADGLGHPPDRAARTDPGCRLFLCTDPLSKRSQRDYHARLPVRPLAVSPRVAARYLDVGARCHLPASWRGPAPLCQAGPAPTVMRSSETTPASASRCAWPSLPSASVAPLTYLRLRLPSTKPRSTTPRQRPSSVR